MQRKFTLVFCFLAMLAGGRFVVAADTSAINVSSPDGRVVIRFHFSTADGSPVYRILYRDRLLIDDSPLGITFQNGGALRHLEIHGTQSETHDASYPILAGKCSTARDHFNETTITLAESGAPRRRVQIVFRAYNDGVAFRYIFLRQPALNDFAITSEDTGFSLPPAATAWVLPLRRHGDEYEYLYKPMNVADIPPGQLIGLPLLLELPWGGPAFAITEADLDNYPGLALTLPADGPKNTLRAALTPLPGQTQIKVKGTAPQASPWRAILIGDSAGQLIESNLIYNLNPPCALADTSWIHPGKIYFLWWNGYVIEPDGRQGGVDTKTFNYYIDAAAEFGFPYSSIDGLKIAWYGGKIPGHGEHDITVPVKALDMQAVLAHAKAKGIRIRLWVAAAGLHKYLDKALDTYEKWGIEGIMVDFIARDDQEEVNWIRQVVAKAAQHHLTVTLHNIFKPTGLARTYPNLLTREAVRNQEYDKWDPQGIPPAHNLTVPFTRMLAGPLDYHMGAFRSVRVADFHPRSVAPVVMGTRCQQLAMYVVYEDPMPMVVDYPDAYRGQPGLDFLVNVPTTWDETRFIQGAVGQYITLARRKGDDWYIGSMSVAPRSLKIPLRFLGNKKYTAEIWSDKPHGSTNELVHQTGDVVSAADTLTAVLGDAGGQVVHLKAGK